MQPADDLYDAERVVHVRGFPARLTDAQAYYDMLVGTAVVRRKWPHLPELDVKVKTCRKACAWTDFTHSKIYLPPWAMNNFTLLHEVAHLAEDDVDHEFAFRQAELFLVRKFMGKDAGRCFHHALLAYDLPH